MKILLLSEYFPGSSSADITGGVEARVYNIAKRLAKNNSVIILTSWKIGQKREETRDNLKIYRVGKHHPYSNYTGFLSRINFTRACYKKGIELEDIDLIDAFNWTTYAPAYFIAKKNRKPVIATYHETWIGEWIKNKGVITGVPYEFYERFLLSLKFNHYISVSSFTKNRLIKRGIKEEKISVIPNGVDIDSFKKIKAEKAKTPTICFIGRLVETKKADVLIKAISIIKKEIPDIKCMIIGQGKESQKLKQFSIDLNLRDNVEFLGFIKENKKVMHILKSSDIFCLPSVLEGFGMVIVEAMALSVPYVCTDIPPLKEITENSKGGLLFESNNSRDLAEKILSLLKNKQLYKKKIEEEKAIIKKYGWDKIVKKTEQTYKEVMANFK